MTLPLTRPAAFTVLPAAVLSQYADEIERIALAVFGSFPAVAAPRVAVRRTSNLPTTSGANTIIPWQTADDQDPDGMWDAGSPTQLTVVTPGAWIWLTQVRYAAGGTTSHVRGPAVLAGGNNPGTNTIASIPGTPEGGGSGPTQQVFAAGRFGVGTQLFVNSFQNTGSTLNLLTDRGGTYFLGFWLGPAV